MMLTRLDAKRYVMFALMMLVATLLALAAAGPARSAYYDQSPLGTGVSGALNPTTNGTINYAVPVTGSGASSVNITTIRTSTATNSPALSGTSGFGSGRLVLLIQSRGYTGTANSGDQDNINLATNAVGRWELARISDATVVNNSTVNFGAPLKYSYTAGAQMVSVPEFTTVTLAASRVITAPAWDGTSGGIIAFLANGDVSMAAGASINATGLGFRGAAKTPSWSASGQTNCTELDTNWNAGTGTFRNGGKGEGILNNFFNATAAPPNSAAGRNTYVTGTVGMGNRANAAGGGNCENAGGGGGGSAGQGGQGGWSYDAGNEQWPVGGLGGQALIYSPYDHMVMGGGGGSGDANNYNNGAGGAGGGIVFVRGASLSGSGTLAANGVVGGDSAATGASDGAGGGGGAGVVYARFAGAAVCTTVSAVGGAGGLDQSNAGVHGPGGAGAGGYVLLQKASGACTTNTLAGLRGYTTKGTVGNPRGATPSTQDDPTSAGVPTQVSTALAAPTATVNAPTANQIVPITSTISGTATALSRIDIYITGASCNQDGVANLCGTTLADGSGNWSWTTPALPGGAHTVTVTPVLLEIAGATTAARNFTTDATAPIAPNIAVPAGPGAWLTNNPTPTISGTAEPASTIQVYDNGNPIAGATTTTSGSDPGVSGTNTGNWSRALPTLSEGSHTITVRATDLRGNLGAVSASRTITIDSVPAMLTVSTPTEGQFINTLTPTVTGSSDKAGAATCQVDSGTQTSCSTGTTVNWTVPGGAISTQGAHQITVRWTDVAGNVTTVIRSFTVDTVLPAISITSPATDNALVKSTRPTVAFTVTDTNASATSSCRVDSQAFGTCESPWSTPTLADGSHTIDIRHTDKAGNVRTVSRTVIVDTTLPTIPTSSIQLDTKLANNSFQMPNPTLTFTVDDLHPGTSECQLDGVPGPNCTSGATILGLWGSWPGQTGISPGVGLTAGQHTIAIIHTDAAGNKGSATSVSFIVDTTNPVVNINWPPAGTINERQPLIDFTVTEANPSATSSCKIDAQAAVPCTSPYTPASIADGSHTLVVTHTDKAGNSGSDTRIFTVDATAPAAPTFSAHPASLTNLTTANFTVVRAEPGGTLECQLDIGGWSAANCSQAWSGLSAGEHVFFARQTDVPGNIGAIAAFVWTIDQTAPPAPIVAGPNGVSGAPTEVFTFYDAEQGVTFTCKLDSGANFPCNSGTYTTPTLTNGAHSFTVWATDAAGNQSSPTTLSWTTDLGQFTLQITGGPTALSASPSGQFQFIASVYGATYHCSLDGGPEQICGSPSQDIKFDYSGLANGDHSFSVYATKDGSAPTATLSRNWRIDASAPTLNVTNPANSGTTGANTTLALTANDNDGVTEITCKLDNAAPVTCADGFPLQNLLAGARTLVVKAFDAAGNVAQQTINWTVDTTPPRTTFDTKPAPATKQATANFTWHADKNPATYECKLDGAVSWSPCTTPYQTTVVSQGVHTLSVRATAFGNTETAPAHYAWTYDISSPNPPTIISDSRVLTSGSVTFRGEGEVGTTVNILITGMGGSQGTSPVAQNGNWEITLPALAEGTYHLCATATDEAGNVSACSDSIELVVDNSAPNLAISSPTGGAIVQSSVVGFTGGDAASAVTYECTADDLTDSGAPDQISVCSPPTYQPALVSGHEYRITIVATDELQNVATQQVTFTFDNTPPARPTITSPATDVSTKVTPVVVGGKAEAGSTVKVFVDGTQRPTTTTANGSGDWTYTFSPDLAQRPAAYDITVTATDAAGNVSQSSLVRKITVDRTAPNAPTIATPANNAGINNPTPAITGAAEANSTLKLSVDGDIKTVSVSGDGTWSYTPPTALANGAHTLTATAVDAAGNESAQSNTVNFRVDNEPPAVAVSSPTNGSYLATKNVTIQFTATDNDSFTLECRMNGSIVTPCAPSSKAFTNLAEGSWTFVVKATDVGGNISTSQTQFTVDTVNPVTPTISQPTVNQYLRGSQVQVSGTAEANTKVDLVLNTQPTPTSFTATVSPSGTWSRTFTGLADGAYNVTAQGRDLAENTSGVASRAFTIDNTAPAAVTIGSPTNGAEVKSITTVSGSGAEDGATVSVTASGNTTNTTALGDGTWSLSLPAPLTIDGSYTIQARQTDKAGNIGPLSSVTAKVDNVAPALTITSPTGGAYITSTTPDITFTTSDNNTLVGSECRVTTLGAPHNVYGACTSPWTTPVLTQGSHTVQVRSTDRAGNVTQKSVTFTVDTTAPIAQFTGTLPGSGNPDFLDNRRALNITFAAAVPEPGLTFLCSLNNAAYTSCSSPWALSGLADGTNTVKVKARDLAMNVTPEGSAATWTWIIDATAPNPPSIVSPTDGAVLVGNTPTVSGTAEPNAKLELAVDGTPIGTLIDVGPDGTWSHTLTSSLTDGTHVFTARATDKAGNTGPKSGDTTVTVDSGPPTVTITTKPAALTKQSNAQFAFTADEQAKFTCKLDSGAAQPCGEIGFAQSGSTNYNLATDGSADGSHTFTVTAKDTSNNSSTPKTWTWTLDTTAPVKPSIQSPEDSSTPLTNGDVEFEALTTDGDVVSLDFVIVGPDGKTVAGDGDNGTWTKTTHLEDGSYTVTATATDHVGNVSAASDTVGFVIDTTAPNGQVSQQAGSGLNGAKAVFNITSDDPSATYKCSIDGSAPVNCSSPYTPAQTLSVGAHTLTVTFSDPSGNSSQKSLGFTQTQQPTPPTPTPPNPGECFPTGFAVTDLAVVGSKVKLTGYARTTLAGKAVTVTFKGAPKKVAGRTTVKADGTFAVSMKAPAKKLRAGSKGQYKVAIDGAGVGPWTKLTRRMATSKATWSNGTLTATGTVTKPFFPKGKATVSARTTCNGAFVNLGKVTINKKGKFTFKKAATSDTGVMFVRIQAEVGNKPKKPKKVKTYSFVMPVVTR
jgi:hypothetical protein